MSDESRNEQGEICVYCGQRGVCTDEHVVPRCFFSKENKPPRDEFIIAPACRSCNGSKAKDDSYIRDVIANDGAFLGVPTVIPLREAYFRSAAKNWSTVFRNTTSGAIIKPLPDREGVFSIDIPSVVVDRNRYSRYFRQITRGVYWEATGDHIPQDYEFQVLKVTKQVYNACVSMDVGTQRREDFQVGTDVYESSLFFAPYDKYCVSHMILLFSTLAFFVCSGPQGFIQEICEKNGIKKREEPLFNPAPTYTRIYSKFDPEHNCLMPIKNCSQYPDKDV